MDGITTHIIKDNQTYIQLELDKLKTLIHRRILWQRHLWNDQKFEQFKGLIIPDNQVDSILHNDTNITDEQEFYKNDVEARKLTKKIKELKEKIKIIQDKAGEDNLFLPLLYLKRVFCLSEFEYNLMILCLAPEVENDFEKLYGYTEDNANRKLPSSALAMNLFCKSKDEMGNARKCFIPTSPLFLFRILHFADEAGTSLSRQVHIGERITSFILSPSPFELNTTDYMRFVKPLNADEYLYPTHIENLTELLHALMSGRKVDDRRVVVNIHGPTGIGKKTLSATAGSNCGFPLLWIDVAKILSMHPERIENALWSALRESLLQSAIPYFDITLLPQENKSRMDIVEQIISKTGIPVFIATEKPWRFLQSANSNRVIPIELPMIAYDTRVKFWKRTVNIPTLDDDIERLASNFMFTPGEIINSVENAKGLAALRSPKAPSLLAEDLWQATRNLPRHKLGELAQKILPIYTWYDIVLPEDIKYHLEEICQQVIYQSKVYEDWGLRSKLSRGAGLSSLFSGPSGTGKTMAAEVIANELNLDLYRIDLSSVVNKYIGETEKNLKKVFDEAEKSNAILFFDEADALFGKRSEVKDSHDRYSNIEISYLLQKMEEYKGLCILATNMRQALDDAFMRRIRFVVEFSMPEADQRKVIWQKGFEPRIPHNGVDFEFLAQQFKISGGNIRNITLNAAFLAAADGGEVEMKHLIRATKREFTKVGKLCLESEFGPYFSLIK